MELLSLQNVLLSVYSLLFIHIGGGAGEEYGSYHDSHPPFHYIRSRFSCISHNKRILWDSIVVEIHPGATEGCGILVPQSQAPGLWSSVDRCLNDGDIASVDECRTDAEYGTVLQVNKTKLITNKNITFPCVQGSDIPEIVAIHIIYTCKNGLKSHIHPEDDIMTMPPRLPPIPPQSGVSTQPPPPPRPQPTMVVEPTIHHTPPPGHIVVTEITTAHTKRTTMISETKEMVTSRQIKPTSKYTKPSHPPDSKPPEESSSHPITYNELAIIIGPSVAAIAVLILILVAIIVLVKRKNLKLPIDLQGESLFHSRRFSTASQLSDISINGQQMRTVP